MCHLSLRLQTYEFSLDICLIKEKNNAKSFDYNIIMSKFAVMIAVSEQQDSFSLEQEN